MRSIYRALALLIALGVLVQAASIAFGWFGDAGDAAHGIVGMTVMPLLGLLLLLTALFAKVAGGKKSAGFVLLAIVAQVVLGIVFFSAPVAGVLHGVNAFIVLGTALMAARRAQAPTAATVDAERTGTAV